MNIADILSPITSVIKSYEAGKKQLMDNHVQHLQENIESIHADYVNNFKEIRSSLRDEKVPVDDLLVFLEDRRHDLASQRDFTKTLAKELQEADRRIVTHDAWLAFKNYCAAVENYFDASNSVACYSWYTQFIQFMKVSRLGGMEEKFFEENVFGNDPRIDLIDHISVILDRRLPNAMAEVNLHYSKLRSHLL